MTDDAELRARIEAQVAARRAGRIPPELVRADDGDASAEPSSDGMPGTGSLAPIRPWERDSDATPGSSASPGTPTTPADRPAAGRPTAPTARPGEPVRPWLRHQPATPARGNSGADDAPRDGQPAARDDGRAAAPRDGQPAAPRDAASPTGLAPARPWESRRADQSAEITTGAPTTPNGEVAAPTVTPNGRSRRAMRRILARRSEAGAEPVEAFTLPDPDAAFDRPWHDSPSPTHDWSGGRPGPVHGQRVGEEPVQAPAEAPVQAPAEAPVQAPAEAMATAATEGSPAAPATEEGAVAPAPVTPAATPERPAPGGSAAGEPSPPVRSRPSPGPNGTPRPKPGAHAARSSAAERVSADISRFLNTGQSPPAADTSTKNGGKKDVKKDEEKDARPAGPGIARRARRWTIRTVVVVVIAAAAALLLRAFVVQPYYIPSASMEPTLHGCTGCNDDHVLVDKISYRAHDVRAGDIVVFDRPSNASYISEKVLIKRVVALPGDVVQLKQGRVFVNGLVLDEPYVNKACGPRPTTPLTSTTKWKVPGNDVFVMGDNRCHSEDSRQFGPIAKSSIIGRAFAIIWPLNRLKLL